MRRRSTGKTQGGTRRTAPLLDRSFLLFGAWFLFLALAGNVLLFQYLEREVSLPSWDRSSYEFKFVEAVQAFREGPLHFLGAVRDSIAHTDNSLLIPSLLAPWGAALGTDRVHFLLFVLNFLAVPSFLVLSFFFQRLVGSGRPGPLALLPAALAFLNPFFWVPLVQGFYDIFLWMGMLLIWALVLFGDERVVWRRAVMVGILLTVLILMRRWMGYGSLAFPLTLGALWVRAKSRGERPLWGLGPLAVACAAGAVTFLAFAPHLMVHALSTDHSALYEAYKRGLSTVGSLWKGVTDHGLAAWGFAGAGVWMARKEVGLRPFLALILPQSFLALVLFARVQNLDPHHQTPFVLTLVLLQSLFLLRLWKGKWKFPVKVGLSFLLGAVLLVNLGQALGALPSFKDPLRLLTAQRAAPERRGDLPEIQRLIGYLGSQKAQAIHVLSASQDLNATTLQNAAYYLRFDDRGTCAKVLFSPTVDVRDGFPWELFRADHVVVADPVQYQLRPQDQQVIGLPALALLEGKGIGKAFRELPQKFRLDGGVTVKVYRRVGKIRFSDVEALNEALKVAHPGSAKFSKEAFLAGR